MKEHEDTLLRELHHAEKQLKDLQYAVPSQDTQQQYQYWAGYKKGIQKAIFRYRQWCQCVNPTSEVLI